MEKPYPSIRLTHALTKGLHDFAECNWADVRIRFIDLDCLLQLWSILGGLISFLDHILVGGYFGGLC